MLNYQRVPSGVIEHAVLENGPFIGDFPFQTSIQFGDFQLAMFGDQWDK